MSCQYIFAEIFPPLYCLGIIRVMSGHMDMVNNFSDFCDELLKSGFSMGGGNDRGIYAVIPFGWNSAPPQSPIVWHTGDPETDPWEWRMRVLKERDDIAYGKVFFGTSGYITREWYPLFFNSSSQKSEKLFTMSVVLSFHF